MPFLFLADVLYVLASLGVVLCLSCTPVVDISLKKSLKIKKNKIKKVKDLFGMP